MRMVESAQKIHGLDNEQLKDLYEYVLKGNQQKREDFTFEKFINGIDEQAVQEKKWKEEKEW